MYLLYYNFGFKGIYIFVLIISSLIAFVFFSTLLRNKNGYVISFIVSIIAIYLSRHFFTARNQIFSLLIFELEIFALNELLEKGKKKYFWVLIILAFLLVAFHDTVYPMFFLFILPYLAEAIFNKMFNLEASSKFEVSDLKNIKYLVILIILALPIGLCTPIFGTAYTNLVNCMNGVSTDFISELETVNFISHYDLNIIIFLIIGILCFTKTKVKIRDLLFVIGLFIFSLMVNRNLIFMYLIGIIFLMNILKSFIDTYWNYDIIIKKLDNSLILVVVMAFLIVIIAVNNFLYKLCQDYVSDYDFPKDATEWILNNLDYENMRIWNSFNWGSYLELNGIKVFLDSRSGMYTEEENKKCTVLKDWLEFNSITLDYEKIFEKYGITHVILENNNKMRKNFIKR